MRNGRSRNPGESSFDWFMASLVQLLESSPIRGRFHMNGERALFSPFLGSKRQKMPLRASFLLLSGRALVPFFLDMLVLWRYFLAKSTLIGRLG